MPWNLFGAIVVGLVAAVAGTRVARARKGSMTVDLPPGRYRCGDTVSGIVSFVLKKPADVQKLTFSLVGGYAERYTVTEDVPTSELHRLRASAREQGRDPGAVPTTRTRERTRFVRIAGLERVLLSESEPLPPGCHTHPVEFSVPAPYFENAEKAYGTALGHFEQQLSDNPADHASRIDLAKVLKSLLNG